MTDYHATLNKHRRLAILRHLEACTDYTSNASILVDVLDDHINRSPPGPIKEPIMLTKPTIEWGAPVTLQKDTVFAHDGGGNVRLNFGAGDPSGPDDGMKLRPEDTTTLTAGTTYRLRLIDGDIEASIYLGELG